MKRVVINDWFIYFPDINESNDKNWLKYNIEPYQEVRNKWESTFNIRQKFLKEAPNLNQILEEWPIYKQSFGYSLVSYVNICKLFVQ